MYDSLDLYLTLQNSTFLFPVATGLSALEEKPQLADFSLQCSLNKKVSLDFQICILFDR